ncbi:MAG: glycosyltransferase family 92 protein [Sphingomonadales bacterium]|nr:glycosyltransferase family 92 protein [Sphingomonadales bacterium]
MQKAITRVERLCKEFVDLPGRVSPRPNRSGLAVVCIAKREERYIREWIAFHRIAGARHVYVYVNEPMAVMSDVTRDFREQGFATLIPWDSFSKAGPPQTLAYAHALANFGPAYRWMAFIDVDEFLFAPRAPDLAEALKPYEALPGIAVPWHMFGTSGHKTPPDGLIIENYTWRAPFPPPRGAIELLQYKSIVDPARVRAIRNGHWFYLANGERAAFNERCRALSFLNEYRRSSAHADIFRLNHYFTRSIADVEAKIARGRIDRSSVRARAGSGFRKRTKRMCALIEQAPVQDTLIQRYLPELRRALAGDERSNVLPIRQRAPEIRQPGKSRSAF